LTPTEFKAISLILKHKVAEGGHEESKKEESRMLDPNQQAALLTKDLPQDFRFIDQKTGDANTGTRNHNPHGEGNTAIGNINSDKKLKTAANNHNKKKRKAMKTFCITYAQFLLLLDRSIRDGEQYFEFAGDRIDQPIDPQNDKQSTTASPGTEIVEIHEASDRARLPNLLTSGKKPHLSRSDASAKDGSKVADKTKVEGGSSRLSSNRSQGGSSSSKNLISASGSGLTLFQSTRQKIQNEVDFDVFLEHHWHPKLGRMLAEGRLGGNPEHEEDENQGSGACKFDPSEIWTEFLLIKGDVQRFVDAEKKMRDEFERQIRGELERKTRDEFQGKKSEPDFNLLDLELNDWIKNELRVPEETYVNNPPTDSAAWFSKEDRELIYRTFKEYQKRLNNSSPGDRLCSSARSRAGRNHGI
jgi:hypothetical protein